MQLEAHESQRELQDDHDEDCGVRLPQRRSDRFFFFFRCRFLSSVATRGIFPDQEKSRRTRLRLPVPVGLFEGGRAAAPHPLCKKVVGRSVPGSRASTE